MKTIEEKKLAVLKHEIDWVLDGASWNDIYDLLKEGFEGFDNWTDEQIEKHYKDNIEEEDDD